MKTVGFSKSFADVALRATNRVIVLKPLRVLCVERVDPAFLECDGMYRGLFLDEAMLREFAADPKNDMTHEFLDKALQKGDRCYGFLAGSALAAYGWYSTRPTDLGLLDLRLYLHNHYVYMYKAFTASDHRGHRLHGVGQTRVLQAYLASGYRGMFTITEWNNFATLKSCYRMGYRDCGSITIMGIPSRFICHHDAECRKHGFWVGRSEDRTYGSAAWSH